ncbi:MAG: hypothetical protein HN704_08955 [Bacteroidetes bacterium]|jgi:hypothetical protein|nr:hypothetical protein [Bacteroidota bacterium]MBT7491721.1 hypothetical protein [Bacteroidota bacterium]
MGCLKLDISDNHFTILEVVHNSLSVNKNSSADAYLFGFQGQEKDDEISGTTGGHTTAMFWEYDTRLARRWNLDPKPNPSISQYATFACNPIWYTDPLGDTLRFGLGILMHKLFPKLISDMGKTAGLNLSIDEKTRNMNYTIDKDATEFSKRARMDIPVMLTPQSGHIDPSRFWF